MTEPRRGVLTPGGVRDLVATFVQQHPQQRDAFLANPAAAISRHLGLVIPDVKIVAVADTADTIHVVVPADADELRDSDLDHIAAGIGGDFAAAPQRSGWTYQASE